MELNSNNGAGPAPENPNIPNNSEFSEVVKESTEKVQAAAAPPPKASGPKRGRGRPPKVTASEPAPGPATAQGAAPGAVPLPDITKHLALPIKLIGSIPARKYKIPEMGLDDNEAMLVAESIKGILDAFIPDVSKMSPKAAALLTAGITIGSVATMKYMVYLSATHVENPVDNPANKTGGEKETEIDLPNDGSAPVMPKGGVRAEDHFRRRQ